MIDKIYYDAHCHIFNLGYAFKEAKCMIAQTCRYSYKTLEEEKGFFDFIGRITDFLKWFSEFISEATGSEEDNFNTLRTDAKKAWNLSSYPRIIPLMMDIQYMFDKPMTNSKDCEEFNEVEIRELDGELLQNIFNKVTDNFLEFYEIKLAEDKDYNLEAFDKVKKIIEDEKLVLLDELAGEKGIGGICMTSGFKAHFEALCKLKEKYPNELYPFLAIDPRRPGIIDEVLKNELVGVGKTFAGIKIYPRLGYTPDCPEMMRIYKYCEENDIPITAHCSQGGFPLAKWQYHDYCNPERYKPILAQFPKLRIDFAHFGYRYKIYDQEYTNKQWNDAIINLLNQYDNVYTDISCYTDKSDLINLRDNYWKKGGKICERLMFGSDFDVMNLTSVGMTLQNYFKQFTEVFGVAVLEQISTINPKNYLNIIDIASKENPKKGHCITIGLNEVDSEHYSGWHGKLTCCENDAKSIVDLLPKGYSSELILTKDATRENITKKIINASEKLNDGDILVLYYSGHGGQVQDIDRDDEEDNLDETWCLYDGQLLDDELYKIWLGIKNKIRILLISDSCHSGTILKSLEADAARAVTKIMPFDVSDAVFRQNIDFYKGILSDIKAKRSDFENEIIPTILLLSACQDNQTASAGYMNSLFTSKLITVWDNGNFRGDYRAFHSRILKLHPATQSPNYVIIGSRNSNFEAENPFTI